MALANSEAKKDGVAAHRRSEDPAQREDILFLSEKLTSPVALGGALIVAGSIVIIVF